eukprot:g1477.t1
MFPVLKNKVSGINIVDTAGVKRLAAALMAVRHINNKKDGFYDDLILPRFRFIFYDSKRSTEQSWWNTAQFSSIYHENKREENYAIVGPASSSPAVHVNRALQDAKIQVAQIGYSSTSPKLAEAQLFARTVPNDILKADILYDLSKQEEVFFPCLIHGDDDYSNGLAEEYKKYYCKDHVCTHRNVRFSKFQTGKTDKNLIDNIFYKLIQKKGEVTYREIFKKCNALILFVQNVDGEHILEHIIKKTNEYGITNFRVYATESVTRIFFKMRLDNAEEAEALLKEARGVDVAQPYTTLRYKTLQTEWHKQIKNCLLHDDRDSSCLLGKKKYPFIANDGVAFKHKCVAFNYSDYKCDDCDCKCDEGFEVSGEGYVDTSVPFAYDSIIAIAHALNFSNPIKADSSSSLVSAQLLYDRIINSTFEGFSGNVKFDSNGDRAPASIMWNIFTFENNKVNMNHCSRDSDKDPYKVTFKSKSTTFKPYRPDCIGIIDEWKCTLGMWFFHLGTVIILSSMFVRTWRLNSNAEQRHIGKSRDDELAARNLELQHDNTMDMRTIVHLSQQIESLKAQVASGRPRNISTHVLERVFSNKKIENKKTIRKTVRDGNLNTSTINPVWDFK